MHELDGSKYKINALTLMQLVPLCAYLEVLPVDVVEE